MNRIAQPLRRRIQLCLLIGVCGWSAFALIADVQSRRDEAARLQRQRWIPASTITLGSRHMAELKELASMAAAQVPEGSVIGVEAKPESSQPHRRQLAICLGYLMPRHHVKELRQRPRVEEYWLTVGHRLRRQDLELVRESSGGALYRVPR